MKNLCGQRAVRRCVAGLLLLFGGTVANAGFVADGSLADWGSNNSWTTDTWTAGLTGTGSGFTYAYFNDDLIGNQGHSATLGPNAGGQDYDAEFMGIAKIGNKLAIVIVTGQRADNGASYFSPGDIRIETSNGIYGIEVGGGKGGLGQTQVVYGDAGSTYVVDSNGYAISPYLNASHPADHTAGTLWKDATWINDPISTPTGSTGPPNFYGQNPVQQFTGGTHIALGDATDYKYIMDSTHGQHAVIELSIDLNALGLTTITEIQWAPACGNDFVYVQPNIHTPEPASFVLGLLGVAGAAGLRRQRRQVA